jgi:hypothetical protein
MLEWRGWWSKPRVDLVLWLITITRHVLGFALRAPPADFNVQAASACT